MTAIDKAQTEACNRGSLRQTTRRVVQFYDERLVHR
jgi:hypothetical protein